MPVRFKGVSEYQKKFRGQSARPRSASLQLGMRQAGLRSDQLGIAKEPQFLSKKRVPFYRPQVPGSLQWQEPEDPQGNQQGSVGQRPSLCPAETPGERPGGSEEPQTPFAPRGLKDADLSSTNPKLDVLPHATPPEHEEPKQLCGPLAPVAKFAPAQNGVTHVLRRKAGLKNPDHRGALYRSEYQRQFLWKTPVARSPLLAAEQMVYGKKGVIPPFKTDSLVLESEYRRNFRGSPPAQGPRLRRHLDDTEEALFQSENVSPEKDMKNERRKKKMKKKQGSRKCSVQRGCTQAAGEGGSPQRQSPVGDAYGSEAVLEERKVKTEYSSNFRSPLQYRYKDGTWINGLTAGDEGCDSNRSHMWYEEVRELRQKAEAYRKRAWGTHFSREHLSQILSEYNRLWEASTTSSAATEELGSRTLHALDLASVKGSAGSRTPLSPVASVGDGMQPGLHDGTTFPVQRKLAWEDAGRGVGEEQQEEEQQHGGKQDGEKEVADKQESSDNEVGAAGKQHLSPASSPDTMKEEGRVPTPRLKTTAVVPRTHHDLTTPATGGAILVSPPKLKDFQGNFRRSEPPLGKPFKHLPQTSICAEPQRADDTNMAQISAAAGLSTLDPIPLREDLLETETYPEGQAAPCHDKLSQKHIGGAPSCHNTTAATARIQGTLRDPEFQHNGNLGLKRPELFVFPPGDLAPLDDDKMSQISSMSAASCSFASQVLTRAQKRKEDFWGKS